MRLELLQVHAGVDSAEGRADGPRGQVPVGATRTGGPRPIYDGRQRVGRETNHGVDVERV